MSLDNSSFWYIIDLVLTNLSIIGSVLMSYFCLLLLRNSPSVHVKIVLLIAISDFFFSLANIMSNFEKGDGVGLLCQTEAIMRQTGFFLTIYFAAVGGVFAQKISKFRTEECKNKFLNKSIAFGLLVSVITLLGLVFASKYIAIEKGPLSCQIGYTPSSTMTERLVFLVLYEGIAITVGSLLTFRAYIHVIREIKSLPKELVSSLNIKAYSLLWYPVVLFGSFLPCMIASFYRVTRPDGEDVPSWVIGFHIVMPHSIGFTNALVYGIQRKIYANSCNKEERKTIDTTGRGQEEEEDDDEKQLMRQLLRAERLANSESIVN